MAALTSNSLTGKGPEPLGCSSAACVPDDYCAIAATSIVAHAQMLSQHDVNELHNKLNESLIAGSPRASFLLLIISPLDLQLHRPLLLSQAVREAKSVVQEEDKDEKAQENSDYLKCAGG